MSEQKQILSTLIELGKLDASISRASLEKKSLDKKLTDRESLRDRARRDLDRRVAELDGRKKEVDQIDRRLKDEQLKLVERRKALATFSNYKLQQAAAREIENSSKQIAEQETSVLTEYEAIEKTATEVEKRKEEFATFLSELETFSSETKDHIAALDERITEKMQEREQILTQVDRKLLSEYNRVQHRHPQDPLVPLVGLQCSGCHMHLTQQTVVELGKGETLVRCRGCGRILFLDEAAAAEGDSNSTKEAHAP